MILGQEPPYRPLLSEKIYIKQGWQDLGQVSAGIGHVDDSLKEWGEYYQELKLKGAWCHLYQ